MDSLAKTVKEHVLWYAGGGFNLKTFPMVNEEQQAYSVIVTDVPTHKRPVSIAVMARVMGDTVIIEEDTTDKPLVERLVQSGIPREKIILAYKGEPITVEMEA